LILSGRGNNVTFIAGHNKDEGTLFVGAAPILVPGVSLPFTEAGLNKYVIISYHILSSIVIATFTIE
jgi:hypothetical protein